MTGLKGLGASLNKFKEAPQPQQDYLDLTAQKGQEDTLENWDDDSTSFTEESLTSPTREQLPVYQKVENQVRSDITTEKMKKEVEQKEQTSRGMFQEPDEREEVQPQPQVKLQETIHTESEPRPQPKAPEVFIGEDSTQPQITNNNNNNHEHNYNAPVTQNISTDSWEDTVEPQPVKPTTVLPTLDTDHIPKDEPATPMDYSHIIETISGEVMEEHNLYNISLGWASGMATAYTPNFYHTYKLGQHRFIGRELDHRERSILFGRIEKAFQERTGDLVVINLVSTIQYNNITHHTLLIDEVMIREYADTFSRVVGFDENELDVTQLKLVVKEND